MWIVLTALRRPYTFVVLAVAIAIFGVRAALLTPTDILPNINIPVVSVVWTYNGLLPNDMSGRVVYFYERYLTAQVADIEHIESQSLSGYGVVKIFFRKNVDIAAALAQVTAASQTVLKLLPPGITPPITPKTGATTQHLVLPGTAQAWYEAPIYARVSGYLKKWYFDYGAHVKEGDVLAKIETPDLDAQLAAAQAKLNAARAVVKVREAERQFAEFDLRALAGLAQGRGLGARTGGEGS